MITSTSQHPPVVLTTNRQGLDQMEEIFLRIERAQAGTNYKKKVSANKYISLQLKLRLLRCYIFSTLFYVVEG